MRMRKWMLSAVGLVGLGLVVPSFAQKSPEARVPSGENFFIVSSVDAEKKQLVLKYPTEVTDLVVVNEKTAYLDENGKALTFSDFRAGDTVYVTFARPGPGGSRLAARIRKSPMTVEELHRRYFKQ